MKSLPPNASTKNVLPSHAIQQIPSLEKQTTVSKQPDTITIATLPIRLYSGLIPKLLFLEITSNHSLNQERTSLPRNSTDPLVGEANDRVHPARQDHGRDASVSLIFKVKTEVVVFQNHCQPQCLPRTYFPPTRFDRSLRGEINDNVHPARQDHGTLPIHLYSS